MCVCVCVCVCGRFSGVCVCVCVSGGSSLHLPRSIFPRRCLSELFTGKKMANQMTVGPELPHGTEPRGAERGSAARHGTERRGRENQCQSDRLWRSICSRGLPRLRRVLGWGWGGVGGLVGNNRCCTYPAIGRCT